jgi:heme exporter protein A
MLKVQSLSCQRGRHLVFRDISFSLEAGALMLVTGANGSGKSSLLRVLAGLLPAADGAVLWQEEPVATDAEAHRERLHYIGHLDAVKPELTAGETVDYWRALRPSPTRTDSVLDTFRLGALSEKPVRYLSAGQKRRLALTRLMLDDAPLWLLDEPTTVLDQDGQKILSDLITAHRMKGGIAITAMHHALDLPDAHILAMPEKKP